MKKAGLHRIALENNTLIFEDPKQVMRRPLPVQFLAGIFEPNGIAQFGQELAFDKLAPIVIDIHKAEGVPLAAFSPNNARFSIVKGRDFASFWLVGCLHYAQSEKTHAQVSFNLMPLTEQGVKVFDDIIKKVHAAIKRDNYASNDAYETSLLSKFADLLEVHAKQMKDSPDKEVLLHAYMWLQTHPGKTLEDLTILATLEIKYLDRDLQSIWAAIQR